MHWFILKSRKFLPMNHIRKTPQINIDAHKELKTEYLNKSKTGANQAIGYFALSGVSLYYFIAHSPLEYLSCIFPMASGISIMAGHSGIQIMNEYNDKANQIQTQINNKSFLTNNTKTTPESNHK